LEEETRRENKNKERGKVQENQRKEKLTQAGKRK
jgi:hypothetical protein